ncbi:MAG: acyltransferase [Myxococcales bacterium]|nr:acyltransferase [Myxococcales bacterium]
MNTPPRDKILDIECLRAFAIIYTLVAHYRFIYAETPHWVEWMDKKVAFHGGVDLFFVISGFVISKNLIPTARAQSELAAKIRFISQFWVRRVYRLWPSSWLWAFIGLGVVAITDRSALTANVYDVTAALLQVYNYHAYSCMTGVGVCSHLAVGVYWSLSLEEQFYIALPVLLVVARSNAKWVLAALLVLSVPVHNSFPLLGGFFRWEAFCIGVLLAWLYANEPVRTSFVEHLFKPLGRTAWLASYLMLFAIPLVGVGALGGASYSLTAICAGVLVALASVDRGYLGIPRVLQPFLVWVGARSYSIYLVHSAVFLTFKALAVRGWREALPSSLQHIGWIGLATAVVLGLSELNFRFVESRFRHAGRAAPA